MFPRLLLRRSRFRKLANSSVWCILTVLSFRFANCTDFPICSPILTSWRGTKSRITSAHSLERNRRETHTELLRSLLRTLEEPSDSLRFRAPNELSDATLGFKFPANPVGEGFMSTATTVGARNTEATHLSTAIDEKALRDLHAQIGSWRTF